MDRQNRNIRHVAPARRLNVPRGRVAVPTREQLLATTRPQVVVQATPSQAQARKPVDTRVTLDNAQPHNPNQAHNPALTHYAHQQQHHHQPQQAPQTHPYYQAQVAAHAQQVAQAEYHRQLQHQQYQRALMVARQQQSATPMVTHGPAAPQAHGAAALPMPVSKAKKQSALQPYKDSVKSVTNKISNSKIVSKLKREDGKIQPSDIVRYAVVTFFVVMASYLAFDTWNTNQQIQNVFRGDEASAQTASADVTNPPVSNGETYPDYQVPADQPRILSIPSLNLTARIKAVGLTSSNKIDVPVDQSFAGWYSSSVAPGGEGASFLTGHYTAGAGGVFDNLRQINEGDTMTVEMGDGTKHEFQVVLKEVLPVGSVDMTRALAPVDAENPGLNIMTCTGAFTASGYSDRLIVYTKEI